jgi:hypothetical protein
MEINDGTRGAVTVQGPQVVGGPWTGWEGMAGLCLRLIVGLCLLPVVAWIALVSGGVEMFRLSQRRWGMVVVLPSPRYGVMAQQGRPRIGSAAKTDRVRRQSLAVSEARRHPCAERR